MSCGCYYIWGDALESNFKNVCLTNKRKPCVNRAPLSSLNGYSLPTFYYSSKVAGMLLEIRILRMLSQ
jgi:hypothetical protein